MLFRSFIDPVLGSVQFHKNGQLKVVGVTSSKRLPNLPDVATVSETIPDFQCASWYGLWGPNKLPADMVQKLNAAVNKALSGEMRDRLIADGIVVLTTSTPVYLYLLQGIPLLSRM